jgi:hypothetical protein
MKLDIQENLLTLCPDLKQLSDGNGIVKLGDLVEYNSDLLYQYNDCAIIHDKLVEAVRKIQNKQEK